MISSIHQTSPLLIVFLGLTSFIASPGRAQEVNLLHSINPDEKVRIVYRSPDGAPPDAFTIDVFWCTGDDQGANRAMAASELAGSIRIAALVRHAGRFKVAEIRTRPIDQRTFVQGVGEATASLAQYNALARFNSSDSRAGTFVKIILPKLDVKVTPYPTVSKEAYVPNYMSFYVCSNFDPATYSGRIFFQIQSAEQKEQITHTANRIQNDYLGVRVAKGIEVVGDKSPEQSEIRYFFKDDADFADKIAGEISRSTNAAVKPKLIEGYESKVRQGTLEAWIADSP